MTLMKINGWKVLCGEMRRRKDSGGVTGATVVVDKGDVNEIQRIIETEEWKPIIVKRSKEFKPEHLSKTLTAQNGNVVNQCLLW